MTATAPGNPTTLTRVGGVRPSQLMYTYGVGALVDLPAISVIVAGLDDWDTTNSSLISEDRLLAAARIELSDPDLAELRAAPWLEETHSVFDDWARTGVPVLPFPRWMRCPRCGLLTASIGADGRSLFNLKVDPARPDRSRFVHTNCNRATTPAVVPARFVVACTDGHIDEFPWIEFTHAKTGGTCTAGAPQLEIQDRGRGTRSTEVQVRCRACNGSSWLTAAFNNPERTMPTCRGREAHLRRFHPNGCPLQVKPLLLGASNAWFPLTLSALSIPASPDPLTELLAQLAHQFGEVRTQADVEPALRFNPNLDQLRGYPAQQVWEKLAALRAAARPGDPTAVDLYRPEWDVLTNPAAAPTGRDFWLTDAGVPRAYTGLLERVVRAERLREVVAMTGFTRIDGPDSGVAEDVAAPNRAPISRTPPTWLPAAEVRGEGIFLALPEARLTDWENRVGASDAAEALRAAHVRWRGRRNLDTAVGWRGHRYTLLHSLSHLLINEIAMESGYSAAAIRERIYAAEGGTDQAMAGILIYTAAPDSEGTLGGLVSIARPEVFTAILTRALDRAGLCAADPLCAQHEPHDTEDTLHLAACHACLFLPETSCERGNRYLDRALVVPTLAHTGNAYFPTQ